MSGRGRGAAADLAAAPEPDALARAPGLSVAAVAVRLGVAPATLRTWSRRYGLGPTGHRAGAHRRYAPADLARLVVMRRLTLEGVPPADAARAALLEPQPGPGADAVTGEELHHHERVVHTVAQLSHAVAPRRAAVPDPARGRQGRRPAAPPWGQDFDRAAVSLEPQDAVRLVDEAFAEHGILAGWEQLISPSLRALSQRWETSGPGVDSVLLLTGAVLTALRQRPAPPPRTSAVVLLAAAEEERDALALHVLAAALAEQGVPSRVLAPGRPPEALAAAVRSTGPAAVVVLATTRVPDAQQLAVLPRMRPAGRLLVLVGPGWDGVALPAGLSPDLVPGLGPAVEAVMHRALP